MTLLAFAPAQAVVPVHELLLACGAAMKETDGIETWAAMPRDRVERRFAAGELFAAGPAERPVAAFALAREPPAFYDLSVFACDGPARYLSLVAVHPNAWGTGLGRATVAAAEERAAGANARSIRLDTAGENRRAQAVFAALGYTQRAPVTPVGTFTFVPYEKALAAVYPR